MAKEIKIIITGAAVRTEVGVFRRGAVVTVSGSWWLKFGQGLKGRAIDAFDYAELVLLASNSKLNGLCKVRGLPFDRVGRRKKVERLLKGIAQAPDVLPVRKGRSADANDRKQLKLGEEE